MIHQDRAHRHAALGDAKRLLIIDSLATGDRSVTELSEITGLNGNLLSHHMGLLEDAGLVERRVSEGDRRRRYVTLRWDRLPPPLVVKAEAEARVAFVCTHNSARSQFAAALWQQLTGHTAPSAGSAPSTRVHPTAVKVASEFDLDLSSAKPEPYSALPEDIDMLISVCDRAREGHLPEAAMSLHWSIPDPVLTDTSDAFRTAFGEISVRVARLAGRDLA